MSGPEISGVQRGDVHVGDVPVDNTEVQQDDRNLLTKESSENYFSFQKKSYIKRVAKVKKQKP